MIQERARLLELAEQWAVHAVNQARQLVSTSTLTMRSHAQATLAMFDVADRLRALANQDDSK